MIAFPWFGGKSQHLSWLLPLLPACHHYCEPFGGSAAVLLNRRPSELETYNDLDGAVCAFFRVLRDDPEELIRALTLTPVAREEFRLAQDDGEHLTDLERARRLFVRVCQSIANTPRTGNSSGWRFRRVIGTERDRNGARTSTVDDWERAVDRLAVVATRFARVQIEHRDALEVIARCDGPETLVYADPPYIAQTRSSRTKYAHEMTDGQHEALANVLHDARGMVALSGYGCPLYDALYRDWQRVEIPVYCNAANQRRTEILWTNYDPALASPQQLPLSLAETGS